MPQNFITLSRSKLYELVWSRPVTELAKEFGISDVALAKRCRAINIPLPGRGYWARIKSGQKPRRTPLPPHGLGKRGRRDDVDPEPSVHFAPKSATADPEPAKPLSPEEAAAHERIAALEISPLADLTSAHPAVLRTARLLKRPWRKDITWPRGARRGPVLRVKDVSEAQQDRALRVLSGVLRAAEELDCPFIAPPAETTDPHRRHADWGPRPPEPPAFGHLLVEGESFVLSIDERRRQSDHAPTDQEKADLKRGRHVWMPRYDYTPSGELRLHLSAADHHWTYKTWKDSRKKPLETQLPKIVTGLLDQALKIKEQRAEAERREIMQREYERQREIIRQRRAANQALIHELERQAGAWHRAEFLRRYLHAARVASGDRTFTVDRQGEPIDFLAWAEHYVNQLDPLHPEPHVDDFAHERSFQYGAEDKRLREELERLSGHTWEQVVIGADAPTDS